MGIHDLADAMFGYLKENQPDEQLDLAFQTLPEMKMTPAEAYRQIVTGNVELVDSDNLENRIAANAVIPCPPGIPMLMSGENFCSSSDPMIKYLHALEKWDKTFPEFEYVAEGAKSVNGKYCVMCVKQ